MVRWVRLSEDVHGIAMGMLILDIASATARPTAADNGPTIRSTPTPLASWFALVIPIDGLAAESAYVVSIFLPATVVPFCSQNRSQPASMSLPLETNVPVDGRKIPILIVPDLPPPPPVLPLPLAPPLLAAEAVPLVV